MAEELGEKTEAPTGRRLSEARQEGQIPKSQELGATIDLIGALVLLLLLGSWLVAGSANLMRELLDASQSGHFVSVDEARPVLWEATKRGAILAIPFLLAMLAIAYLAQLVQVGWLITLRPLKPKWNRLSPAAGAKRIFGKRNAVKSALSVIKLCVFLAVSYGVLLKHLEQVSQVALLDVLPAMAVIGVLVRDLCIWLLAAMLVVAIADYMFQRWHHTQELKMTKQAVKDEMRSMEGDPETKGRRLRMARQMALQRLNQTVPKADVVITNPTHFSVALQYTHDGPKAMAAPKVVAKGADFMAFRIREIANIHGVPIIEKPPLARALYAEVDVGRQISPEFYEAVAEVLAYVYRLENRKVG